MLHVRHKSRGAAAGRRALIRPRGFTLVELVAALTITAFVTGVTVIVLQTTLRARHQVERAVDTASESHAAVDAIATALYNAYRPVAHQDQMFEGIDDDWDGVPADRRIGCRFSR